MTVNRRRFRDWRRYAVALATEAAAPLLRLVARAASRSRATAPAEWRSGVILGNGHIGDALFRTCSLDLLKRGLPECEWSYLTTPPGAAVLAGNPALTEVLPWVVDSAHEPLEHGRFGELKKRNFDVALCTENVEHHRALVLALRLGIPNRVAFTQKGLSALATVGVSLPDALPHAVPFRRMVEQLTGTQDASPLRPRVFPSQSDLRAAGEEWSRLGFDNAEFVIACSVSTRQSVSACPPALFVDILREALGIAPAARVVLTGVAADRPLLESMALALGDRAVVTAGVLGILPYGALLRRCAAFLGTDSGPRHLANAAEIPVFFVRSLGAAAIETGIYCATETDIAPPGEYLVESEKLRVIAQIDRVAVATSLVNAARQQLRDRSAGTPL